MSDQWVRGTTVVFDKSQGKQSQLDHQTTRGLKILFAVEHDEADDLIEELIKAHHSPKSLIVVSSDLRVRRHAMARRAQSIDAETFSGSLRRPLSRLAWVYRIYGGSFRSATHRR